MKTTTLAAIGLSIFSVTLLPLIPAAHAEQNRFYFQADVGGTSAEDVKLREFFGQAIAANSEISLDPGVRLGIRAGYGITDWLAGELETGISANNIESITGATVADGSIANVPFMINARLQVPERNRVSVYAGGGFGIASTILTGDDIIIGATSFSGSAADAVFAFQGFAGLRFAVTDHIGLNLEYHYFRAGASNMSADLTVGTPTDRVKLGRTESHSVSVAVDFRF